MRLICQVTPLITDMLDKNILVESVLFLAKDGLNAGLV